MSLDTCKSSRTKYYHEFQGIASAIDSWVSGIAAHLFALIMLD